MRKILFIFYLMAFTVSCKKNSEPAAPVNCNPGHARMDTAVLLVLGQSNAANTGETKYRSTCIGALNFYEGKFYTLEDPLKGANGDGGSVWSRLCDILLQNGMARVVVIAPVAIGGTYIGQWKPGGMYNHLITEAIFSLELKGLTITHILWHQGEYNNAFLDSSRTPEENAQRYREDFLSLVAQFRAMGVNAPVFPAIATRCADVPPDLVLGQAQHDLANDTLGIYNGPNTDLLGWEYRRDGCHFNDLGLRIHAMLWADKLFAH